MLRDSCRLLVPERAHHSEFADKNQSSVTKWQVPGSLLSTPVLLNGLDYIARCSQLSLQDSSVWGREHFLFLSFLEFLGLLTE